MNKLTCFIKKERLYILILTFVLLFNLIGVLYPHKSDKAGKGKAGTAAVQKEKYEQEVEARRANMEKALQNNLRLAALFGLAMLLVLALILLGIFIDLLVSASMLRGSFNIRTLSPPAAGWTLWDVCKVMILFLFFGYMIVISEAFLSRIAPILKSDNVRMIINTSVLDIIAAVLIIYFAVMQYKKNLKDLGLSLKNFFNNVFYGVAGYIALVPVLVLILAATAAVINITKYVPAQQPVVELLLKEKNAAFLTYSSLFAAILGPVIEELFFRGFLYAAFKRYIGVFWSMLITAVFFAALHAHPVGFLPIVALGILLAYLYEKTGTLVSSMTVHIIHNLSMVFLALLIKQVGAG